MPWCEGCAKYWTPSAMNSDGTCPHCGDVVDDQHVAVDPADERAPWHFKLMVAALVVYLVWRFAQIFS
jgi:hypothetical protein